MFYIINLLIIVLFFNINFTCDNIIISLQEKRRNRKKEIFIKLKKDLSKVRKIYIKKLLPIYNTSLINNIIFY